MAIKRWAAVFILWILTTVGALAATPELNLSWTGLALRGYDPVAYFTVGEPVKGKRSLSVEHGGGTYRFSSQETRELFLADPDKYLPAYGGYCAYGTAQNTKVDGDPRIWHIVDGRLYLNITRDVDRVWQQDIAGYIAQADRIWPNIKYD